MLKSPDLSLLPLALRLGSSSLGCLLGCVLSQLFDLLGCSFSCLLCCLLSQLFYFLRCRLGCLLSRMLSQLFDLLGRRLDCLLCQMLSQLFYFLRCSLSCLLCRVLSELFDLLRRRLSRIHFRLRERKRKAKEVHVSIERRAHQPLERLLLIRNQIPEGCVGSPVYHFFFPYFFRSRRHDCTLFFTRS